MHKSIAKAMLQWTATREPDKSRQVRVLVLYNLLREDASTTRKAGRTVTEP